MPDVGKIELIEEQFISMNGITKFFDGVAVLKNVDFSISKGEVVALMGENGAGKSTLMKILSGVYSADNGTITIGSTELKIKDVKSGMNAGVVLIHQELNLLDNLDVASNIFLGREPTGTFGVINRKLLYSSARKVLDILGMKIPVDAPIASLSLGEQQMIEIAKAISQDARVLIMDEPTSSLTITERKSLFNVIQDLKSRGVSIIYISHRLSEVYKIADRAVILKDGANSGELKKSEINHENILKLMVGRALAPTGVRLMNATYQYDFSLSDVRTARYPESKVNLKIARSEIVGVAGLMGAGRTELANSIFGITPIVGGKIFLNGVEIVIRNPAEAIRRGIFLVPEDRRKQGIITEMDIVDNVTITNLTAYSKLKWVRTNLTRDVAAKQSTRLNIASAKNNSLVKFLSGGNQQKVAIAKWLTRVPEVLIFDEPTRGVDIGAKAEIYSIMRQIANAGAMILMVSSDMEEVIKISDRILVMAEGVIRGELQRSEFSEENIIKLAVAN